MFHWFIGSARVLTILVTTAQRQLQLDTYDFYYGTRRLPQYLL